MKLSLILCLMPVTTGTTCFKAKVDYKHHCCENSSSFIGPSDVLVGKTWAAFFPDNAVNGSSYIDYLYEDGSWLVVEVSGDVFQLVNTPSLPTVLRIEPRSVGKAPWMPRWTSPFTSEAFFDGDPSKVMSFSFAADGSYFDNHITWLDTVQRYEQITDSVWTFNFYNA